MSMNELLDTIRSIQREREIERKSLCVVSGKKGCSGGSLTKKLAKHFNAMAGDNNFVHALPPVAFCVLSSMAAQLGSQLKIMDTN